MKKIAFTLFATLLLCSCSSITPEQRAKIVDLVIEGISIAEQVYVADQQTKEEDFVLEGVYANGDLAYQSALGIKLLKQDGSKKVFPQTGQTYATALKHFVVKQVELQQTGATETPLRIKNAKVEKGVIVELMFCLKQEDGSYIDEECPSCVIW